jgi:antitoxin component of MazEF toxin-antitoxin module
MQATYKTVIIPEGNHASLHIPDAVLAELGANRRAALKITINNHTYRSTATAVAGECRVVFPQRDREAAGVASGEVTVTLELETGHREVELHPELAAALEGAQLRDVFEALTYSKRREFARQVDEAKADDTRSRRIQKLLSALTESN